MYVQSSSSYFIEEIFIQPMSEWLNIQTCVCFEDSQTHRTDKSNQNHKMKTKAK